MSLACNSLQKFTDFSVRAPLHTNVHQSDRAQYKKSTIIVTKKLIFLKYLYLHNKCAMCRILNLQVYFYDSINHKVTVMGKSK